MIVSAVVLSRFGKPAEVLHLEQQELRAPGAGEVLVQMRCASVNPADFNIIEGSYGRLPELPAVCGHEGAGVVVSLGPNTGALRVGQWVRPAPGIGCWRQALVCRAEELWPLPDGLTDEQAASLTVNPSTAWRLLHDFVALQSGDWVLQNAGNSAVGRLVIQIGRRLGLRTLSLVRRAELISELQADGADVVLAGRPRSGEIAARTGGAPLRLALNAVGGLSALTLAKALAPGGALITYGAMGRRPLAVPAGLLIFRDLQIRGFWMTAWYERASAEERDAMLAELGRMFREGALRVPVEGTYPLAELQQALTAAARSGRRGKILLQLSEVLLAST